MMSWTQPVNLLSTHLVDDFDCGEELLNHWLIRHSYKNEKSSASRTYVTLDENKVIGYFALACGSINHPSAPPKLKRNMPDPLPLLVLGRLAVDRRYQRFGIGKALLKDAVLRTVQVSELAGVCSLVVHAISDEAVAFYMRNGFFPSPLHPKTLFLPMKHIRRSMIKA